MLANTTRASSAKRVRKAPKRPDFELAEPTRTPIRKKPRPKAPHRKKTKQRATAPDEELAQAVEGAFAYDEVMRDLASHFDGAIQPDAPENLPGHEDSMLLPQFDPDCAPRTMGPWSQAEDEKLMTLVRTVGAKNWPFIAKCMVGRTNKQCRERWHNHLNPEVSRDAWTIEEDLVIHRTVSEIGHKWSEIAARLRGRTDSAVKNRYNGRLKSMSDAAIRMEALSDTPTTELMHELVRRNALAEEERKPGRFSIGQIEALACRDKEAVITSGCRWSNDEHARLSHAIPDGVPVGKIDWFAASRAVPTRTTVACRRHWESYLRGGWKPAPFGPKEPEPEPSLGEDVEAAVETLETHCVLVAQHANDPKQLALMALETYDEGSYGPTWSRSSVLVVGKPGLNFEFAAHGETMPPPPPRVDVMARPVSSQTKLETVERWEWVTKKLVCSAWAPPTGQWQRELEKDGEAARSEAPAPHTPPTPHTPWHRRSKRPAWQYYRQKKPRCTDVANPTKASDEECHVFATGAPEKTESV
ncbi:MAG: hypothetical protein CMB11_04955 [Euryarchaeota archaeon]|nr:hypothetical protein [Euryarchaeota archaeon]